LSLTGLQLDLVAADLRRMRIQMRHARRELLRVFHEARHIREPLGICDRIRDLGRNPKNLVETPVLQNLPLLRIDDENAIERRIHLRLEERRLPAQLFLDALALGHVALNAYEPVRPAIGIANGRDGQIVPKRRAILPIIEDFALEGRAGVQRGADFPDGLRIRLRPL
jgi:hypothetical protein